MDCAFCNDGTPLMQRPAVIHCGNCHREEPCALGHAVMRIICSACTCEVCWEPRHAANWCPEERRAMEAITGSDGSTEAPDVESV